MRHPIGRRDRNIKKCKIIMITEKFKTVKETSNLFSVDIIGEN